MGRLFMMDHYHRGIALAQQGQWQAASLAFQEAVQAQPTFAAATCNWGVALLQLQDWQAAEAALQRALALEPTLAPAHFNLGLVRQHQGDRLGAIVYFRQALALNPTLAEAHYHLALALRSQGDGQAALSHLQQAVQCQPTLLLAWLELGHSLLAQGEIDTAIVCYQQILAQQPNHADAYAALCQAFYQQGNLEAMRAVTDDYRQICGQSDPWRALLYSIRAYLHSGLHTVAVDCLQVLSTLAQSRPDPALAALYPELLWHLPYLRDDLAANSAMAQRVADRYFAGFPAIVVAPDSRPTHTDPQAPLRIGVISKYFRRISEGWCCRESIPALAHFTPHLFLYATARFVEDDLTAEFQRAAAKFHWPPVLDHQVYLDDPQQLLPELLADRLDVLIDLDSVMSRSHPQILRYHPAPICVSWLGFEPPIVSPQHYFLCDHHTHPADRQIYYREQLLRLPHSFIASAGFGDVTIHRPTERQRWQIGPEQIVYLCIAPGLKITPELIAAQMQILRAVPNSILLHKGSGDTDRQQAGGPVIQSLYHQACQQWGIAWDRLRFLHRTATEEEHRQVYTIADVMLDSYPFNGVTHSLEALWFELPVVTLVGQQLYARATYSFLQTLGLSIGISTSWSEYVAQAIALGLQCSLRQRAQQHLQQAKQPSTRSPLWNPQQLAKDIYTSLQASLNDSSTNLHYSSKLGS